MDKWKRGEEIYEVIDSALSLKDKAPTIPAFPRLQNLTTEKGKTSGVFGSI